MESVRLQPGQYFAPLFMAIVAYSLQVTSAAPLWPNIAMILLATATHMLCMALRDAEFRALTQEQGLATRDIIARICTVAFDTLVIFGLITGAGYHLFWQTYLNFALLLLLLMPLWTYYTIRKHHAPDRAAPGFGPRHWIPPLFLVLLAALLWQAQTFQAPSGNHPFVYLVLLSAVLVRIDRRTTFQGGARMASLLVIVSAAVLLVWNYLNLS